MTFREGVEELGCSSANPEPEPISPGRVNDLRRKSMQPKGPWININKILAPVNASSRSLALVRYGAALAGLFGASVCALHLAPCDCVTRRFRQLGLMPSPSGVLSPGERLSRTLMGLAIALTLGQRTSENTCPLCLQIHAVELLHRHIFAEDPRLRRRTVNVIQAYHSGWMEEHGACGSCWRSYRDAGQILDLIKRTRPQTDAGQWKPVEPVVRHDYPIQPGPPTAD